MQVDLKYFKPSEFQKCTPKCDISQMSAYFLHQLDNARAEAGIMFRLNSAYRSSDYDLAHHRSGKGFHTKGRAVDVSCRDSAFRSRIIAACRKFGLSCGVSKTFIHIDNRMAEDGYPEPIVFLY